MMTLIIFLVALSILIFVHEWGHFIVAKLSGVRVDIFSIGFGPKIFGFKWHGTEYRFAPFPFGGYVKIYGHDPMVEAEGDKEKALEIAKDPEAFASKPFINRMAVVLAGPVMNIILCLVVLPLVFMVGRMQPKIIYDKPIVAEVMVESPAEKAGLQKGDLILSFNDLEVAVWKDLMTEIMLHPDEQVTLGVERHGKKIKVSPTIVLKKTSGQKVGYLGIEPYEFDYGNRAIVGKIIKDSPAEKDGLMQDDLILAIDGKKTPYWSWMEKAIRASEGKALTFLVQRSKEGGEPDQKVHVVVTPKYNEKYQAYLVGISPSFDKDNFIMDKHGFADSVVLGFGEFKSLLFKTTEILYKLFTGQLSLKVLGGPFQIAKVTSSAAKSGLGEFLFILAFISLQLGILNLLPIPILDGGHLVFMSFEAITRREISHRVRMVSMQIGLAILLALMIFVTINDVDNIWGFKNILESIKALF